MMADSPGQPELPQAARELLAALRGRIRRYVWVQGVAWVVGCLGVAFWASLAVDWFFEPPSPVRALLLAVAGAALGWVLLNMVFRRILVRLPDRNLALLLERYFPQFDESLVTAVELTGRKPRAAPCNPDMLARTCRLAADPVGDVQLRKVFNPRPLRRGVLAAALLGVTIGVFGVCWPEALRIWAKRSVLLADELWPRKTKLLVEGFPNGTAKVARGADLTVIAKADLRMPLVPAVVKVRYRQARGSRHQETMAREGTVDPARDRFQEYSHTFRGVLTPIRFDVIGGDDSVRDLRVEVVDNPTILEMALDLRYPEYMARRPRTLPVTGPMPIPVGSHVTLHAQANKELVRVRIDTAMQDAQETAAVLDLADKPDRRSFAFTIEDFRQDHSLSFTLHDVDRVTSREPLRLTLVAVGDEPPELSVRLRGIGSAITPEARLPAAGEVTDDYGIARVWFEYELNDGPPRRALIQAARGNPTELPLRHALEARDLGMSPSDRLLLCVKAADRYDLGGGPNVGSSERWLLEVVRADQLRTMLESRELVLRQRFEAIVAEAVETRDLLARIEFSDPAADGEEPGAPPEDETRDSPQRQLNLRTLRVGRAIQNSRKHAHETLGVALAFEEIRQQLINNRIDTEELKIRLQEAIADPLRQIADRMYPELDRQLAELADLLDDPEAGRPGRDRAVTRLDAILAAMNDVLASMIELEDFNEVVELLREIIQAQEELKAQTEQRHKRELLED